MGPQWNESTVVVPRGSVIGPNCSRCGEPASKSVNLSFGQLSGLGVAVLGVVAASIFQDRASVKAFMCDTCWRQHRAAVQRERGYILVAALFAGAAFAFVLDDGLYMFTFGFMAASVVVCLVSWVSRGMADRIVSRGMTASTIELAGVHPEAFGEKKSVASV